MTHGEPLGNADAPARRRRNVPGQVALVELSVDSDMSSVLANTTRDYLARELGRRVTVTYERRVAYIAVLKMSDNQYEAYGPYTSELELSTQHPNADYIVEGYQW